jgi:hypothetical protein
MYFGQVNVEPHLSGWWEIAWVEDGQRVHKLADSQSRAIGMAKAVNARLRLHNRRRESDDALQPCRFS